MWNYVNMNTLDIGYCRPRLIHVLHTYILHTYQGKVLVYWTNHFPQTPADFSNKKARNKITCQKVFKMKDTTSTSVKRLYDEGRMRWHNNITLQKSWWCWFMTFGGHSWLQVSKRLTLPKWGCCRDCQPDPLRCSAILKVKEGNGNLMLYYSKVAVSLLLSQLRPFK